MRQFIVLLFIGVIISLSSCRKDFSTVPSTGALTFSASKVYLDTIFTNISSSTYMLKVYNHSNKDISIPTIQLGKGLASKYRIMVDGMTGNQGKIFNNVELLAKDSLFVFIEITANVADTAPDFTYNDQILFDSGANQQSVDLITLINDAKFFFPNRTLNPTLYETINVNGFDPQTTGHTLTASELNWDNSKPIVIYGNVVVPTGQTLTIGLGTSVYFHQDATLIVDNGAKIVISGGLNSYNTDGTILAKNEVTFEGDRLEPEYEHVPGQWGALILLSGQNNSIEHLTLKNAVVGLYVTNNSNTPPQLNITNSQFYGCSNYGILANNSIITGTNLVINSAGQASLACSQFGPYNFTNCTFNNNWQSSKQVAVLVNDYYVDNNNVAQVSNVTANFSNCIIYGSNNIELYLDKKGSNFTANIDHCLIKFSELGTTLAGNTFYDFIINPTMASSLGNIKSQNPKFKNIDKNQLNILAGSPAIGTGYSNSILYDIINNSRPALNPDMGAYQHQP